MGQVIIIKRSVFTSFFASFYKVEPSRANYIFTCWAIFLRYAEVRAGADKAIKLALSTHVATVSNNKNALLSAAPHKIEDYKHFVERITPTLYEQMKRDLPYIDDAIKESEAERVTKPGRADIFDSVSIDLSLNSEKPLYERCVEVFDSAGLTVSEKSFGATETLKEWYSRIKQSAGDAVDRVGVELGLTERDKKVVVAGTGSNKVSTPVSELKQRSGQSKNLDEVQIVDEGFSILEGVDTSDVSTVVRKKQYRSNTDEEPARYMKMIDKDRFGNERVVDSIRVPDGDSPLLDLLTGGVE